MKLFNVTDLAAAERGYEDLADLNRKPYGSPYVTFRLVDIHVAERVRNLLRRRHKLPRATSRFGYNEVHGSLGIIEVRRLLSPHACT